LLPKYDGKKTEMDMNHKLTKRLVESIQPHEKHEKVVWDSEQKGFGVRVSPKGLRSYFVQYRNQQGNTRKKKIGVHGTYTADMARDDAITILRAVAKGADPSLEKKIEKQIPNMEKFSNEYLEIHAKGGKAERTYKEDKRMLLKYILPELGKKAITEVNSHDLALLHSKLRQTPYQANRIRSLLSKMFNLAIQWGWLAETPVKNVKKYKEFEKTRWLDEEELCKLWDTINRYHNQSLSNAVRLLVFTGARKNEVLHAKWDQFDLKKGTWTKPAHSTKEKKEQHLPLSEQAVQLLEHMKEHSTSTYLFPGKVPGQPLQEIKKGWATILRLAGLKDVRIHDLRHTYASHLVSEGEDLYTLSKLLGHSQISTTRRYAHLANKPLRKATTVFGDKIERLTSQDKGRMDDNTSGF